MQVINSFIISFFVLVGVSYAGIWIKIQRTTQLMKGSTTERYQSSAKVRIDYLFANIITCFCPFTWFPKGLFTNLTLGSLQRHLLTSFLTCITYLLECFLSSLLSSFVIYLF